MQNYISIKRELKDALENLNISKANEKIKALELLLQENIAADETRLENNEPLVCFETNENIKVIIFDAHLEIAMRTLSGNNDTNLKVYLDDKRTTPDGYLRAFWPEHVTEYLNLLPIKEISLDHDLGDDEHGTGYDVVCFLEEKVYFDRNYKLPEIKTHTDNSSARDKMWRGIDNILKMSENK